MAAPTRPADSGIPRANAARSSALGNRFPRAVAAVVGVVLLAIGVWALVDPRSFFETVATFEPYNQHFLQDVGAFQIGLGAVLLLAALPAHTDGLAVALVGVGLGSALHALSHLVGIDLGGRPETDIPFLAIMTVLLLAAGWLRWRR